MAEQGSRKLQTVIAVFTVVGLAVVGFKYLDLGAMLEAWQKFSWSAWGYLLLLPAFYLFCKSLRFAVLMKPVTEVGSRAVAYGYAASQAASLLPGGVAMRAAMMHRVGVPVESSTGPILANSAADQSLLLMMGLGLCYYYPDFRTSAFGLTLVLFFLVAALWFQPTREFLQRRLLSVASRFGWQERVEEFYSNLGQMWRPSMWAQVFVWTALANLTSIVALCLVVSSLGFAVEPWPLAAAFVIPGLLGRLSPLPAGAGVTEAGMIGFMAAQTSMSYNQAAVATVIFRFVDTLLPALYGGVIQLCFLRSFKSVPSTPEVAL